MAAIDLEKLDVEGLKDVIARVQELLAEKQQQEKARFLEEVREKAGELGISLEELVKPARRQRAAPRKATIAPKYRNPQDPTQTWSGRGRAPAWARPYKEEDRLDEIAIGG
jgi:DNA-binding protein H-NS